MKIIAETGNENLAKVYLAKLSNNRHIEFVESKIPNMPREKKWVLILSTLIGCPVKCPMCDAGDIEYQGQLTKQEIFSQIDYLVNKHYDGKNIPVEKFKIQFARIGEPSFNQQVLDVLEDLPKRYNAPGLIPAISTIGPTNQIKFFEKLILIKNKYYRERFQLQFSVHSTCEQARKKIIPTPHLNLKDISEYGEKFYKKDDKKITLNFIAIKDVPFEPNIIKKHFSPEKFLIKITPLNPTNKAHFKGLKNDIDPHNPHTYSTSNKLKKLGYDVILSIGELEENNIGSNCGQYIKTHLDQKNKITSAYKYPLSF